MLFMAVSVQSQVLLDENFDAAAGNDFEEVIDFSGNPVRPGELFTIVPAGWTVRTELRPEEDTFSAAFPYPGWVSLYDYEWDTQGGERENSPEGFSGGLMIADSDLFGSLGAKSWLYSPILNLPSGKNAVVVQFDNHYRHNDNQVASLQVSWDGGHVFQPVFQWDDSNHNDNQSYIGHEIFAIPVPTGAQTVQLAFVFAGDSDQDGYYDYDWYWVIDNVLVSAQDISAPNTPTLKVSLVNPGQFDSGILLEGPAFVSGMGAIHEKTHWELALDSLFTQIIYSSETTEHLTEIVLNATVAPIGRVIYARVRYIDNNGATSEFSSAQAITISPPAGIRPLFVEDFESTNEGSLPSGWREMSFNGGTSNDPVMDMAASWVVVEASTLAAFGSERVNRPVFEGKSVYANSDGFSPYQESHLFTPPINLSGVTNVWLTFWSNYVQNQDNIGVLEYSINGGNLDENHTVTGTWLPIAYMMDHLDIVVDAAGNPVAAQTFTDTNLADGTGHPYAYFVFARPLSSLDAYLSPRIDDDKTEGKRYERYRLSAADNQSNVVIRWMNMGTNSWFWGVDNVVIWGDDGTSVADWSLY